jgi:hypothetical protein
VFKEHRVWDAYKRLETDFLEISNYVALVTTHDDVYSQKLAELVLLTGGLVDSTFREMTKYHGLDHLRGVNDVRDKVAKDRVSILDYRNLFEEYYSLSSLKVDVRRDNYGPITPFSAFASKQPNEQSPFWWRVYTDLKHDVYSNLEDAAIKCGLHILGAFFLQNVFHMEGRDEIVNLGIVSSGYPLSEGHVVGSFAPGYLKEILAKDPRVIPSEGVPIWVGTDLFLFQFPISK